MRAQFVPLNDEGWDNKKLQISKLRCDQEILVRQPHNSAPESPTQASLVSKVGGFLTLGSAQCKTTLEINKTKYQLGELIVATVTCDNSATRSDIKSIKIKLKKMINTKGKYEGQWMTVDTQEFVAGSKEPGCKAGEKITREFKLQVPKRQVLHDIPPKSTDVDVRLLLTQPISVHGVNIHVRYAVEVFVHHVGWQHKGKGSSTGIPVDLVQRERTSPFHQQPIELPIHWSPETFTTVEFEADDGTVGKQYRDQVAKLQSAFKLASSKKSTK